MQKQTKPKLNEKLLTSEQRDKLEQYQQAETQLQTLQDIADITQEMLGVLDAQAKDRNSTSHNIGAVLTDMRNTLQAIKDKDDPETPDYAKPVVEAVAELKKSLTAAIKSIDVKPVIDAPQVNVNPPDVDLKGVEKVMSEIPKAFDKAIGQIKIPEPQKTDYQPLLDAWEGISEQLLSIENATRMKPLPGSMVISNLNEITSTILTTSDPTYASRLDDTSTADTIYIGKAAVGADEADDVWQIAKLDTSSGLIKTWAGSAGFTQVWDDRTSLTYL